MNKLTDLEICKRIAEIEGVDWFVSEGVVSAQNDLGLCREYNPLTDDGLCFRLMVKYKVDVDFTGDGYTRAWQYDHNDGQETLGKNPNKVICLAIIEASK